MAVPLQIKVDPSGTEQGFKKHGPAAEEAADATKKASDRSGHAEIEALDERIRRVRDLAQEIKELTREQELGAGSATQAVAHLAGEVGNLAAAWAKIGDLSRAAEGEIVAAMKVVSDVLTRQKGLASGQIIAAKEALRIAGQIAREQAQQAAELEEIRVWQQSVARLAEANEESGRRRRARQNSY